MAEFNQKGLTGNTIPVLSRALDYRSANQRVIAGNLANIDTPGYRPKALSFDEQLEKALDRTSVPLKRTNPKHFSHYSGNGLYGKSNFKLETQSSAHSQTNQLNIDKEMSKMVQNNLLYESAVRLLSKKFGALRTAIEEGRR
jgi:flagellar basal-body rod protein FlgB